MLSLRNFMLWTATLSKAGIQTFPVRCKPSRVALVLTILVGALQCYTAHAGSVSGQVRYIKSRAWDGLVWIDVTGLRANKPACATHDYMMIKDENSETGKKQFAMLLQAHATGKSVVVYGTGDCSRWGDGESIDTVEILQ